MFQGLRAFLVTDNGQTHIVIIVRPKGRAIPDDCRDLGVKYQGQAYMY